MRIRHAALWSRSALVAAVTLWLAHWSVFYIEPPHERFYLLVLGGFLVSTLPRWRRLRP